MFFRQQVLNHFTYLTGDPYDGVIQVALLEHWFNFFKGMSHWASPNYFFPYAKTLGYNEGTCSSVLFFSWAALNVKGGSV